MRLRRNPGIIPIHGWIYNQQKLVYRGGFLKRWNSKLTTLQMITTGVSTQSLADSAHKAADLITEKEAGYSLTSLKSSA